MEKVKILFILPSLDAGGAERFTLDLIRQLDSARFAPELLLFAHGGFFLDTARAAGIPVTVLSKRWKFDPLNFRDLYQAIKKSHPLIVHTMLGGDVYGRLAAYLLGVPVIVSTEQNVNPREPWWLTLAKSLTGRLADKVVAISEAVKADAKQRYHLPETRLEKIYNGIEVGRFTPAPPHPEQDYIKGGSIGRLSAQKNFSLLLEALALVPNLPLRLQIAGEGELRPQLEEQIVRLGLGDKVTLSGVCADIPGFLQTLDFFVLPSLWEGLGNVILEAGLCSLPVIASRVDGPAEIISDGESGLLFHSGVVTDLAAKLRQLVAAHGNGADRHWGEALRARVLADFDIRIVTQRYENLYERLLASKSKRLA